MVFTLWLFVFAFEEKQIRRIKKLGNKSKSQLNRKQIGSQFESSSLVGESNYQSKPAKSETHESHIF
jgi:hypothetical protein